MNIVSPTARRSGPPSYISPRHRWLESISLPVSHRRWYTSVIRQCLHLQQQPLHSLVPLKWKQAAGVCLQVRKYFLSLVKKSQRKFIGIQLSVSGFMDPVYEIDVHSRWLGRPAVSASISPRHLWNLSATCEHPFSGPGWDEWWCVTGRRTSSRQFI